MKNKWLTIYNPFIILRLYKLSLEKFKFEKKLF